MLFPPFYAPTSVGVTDSFKHNYLGVHQGTHNRFRPLFQLDASIELMEKLALRFEEAQVVYNYSFK